MTSLQHLSSSLIYIALKSVIPPSTLRSLWRAHLSRSNLTTPFSSSFYSRILKSCQDAAIEVHPITGSRTGGNGVEFSFPTSFRVSLLANGLGVSSSTLARYSHTDARLFLYIFRACRWQRAACFQPTNTESEPRQLTSVPPWPDEHECP